MPIDEPEPCAASAEELGFCFKVRKAMTLAMIAKNPTNGSSENNPR